jgi:hypothetical protein
MKIQIFHHAKTQSSKKISKVASVNDDNTCSNDGYLGKDT